MLTTVFTLLALLGASDTADRLLQRWAPTLALEMADPTRDHPTRIDFDGDWDTTNNWDHQPQLLADSPVYIYGAAILTETHAYLTYTLYYPRDWASVCIPYLCHDNDLESVQLVVSRDGDVGHLVWVESKKHHRFRALRGDQVARDADGRPILSVEAHGHGIEPCRAKPCASTDGRTLSARDYTLLPLRETLWARRAGTDAIWSDDTLHYVGSPLGRMGQAMGMALAGKRYAGIVRPPWGLEAPGSRRGDWFLDPARVMLSRFDPPEVGLPGALRYVWNPFLEDLLGECWGEACPLPIAKRASVWPLLDVGAAILVAAGLWHFSPRRRAGRQSSARRQKR